MATAQTLKPLLWRTAFFRPSPQAPLVALRAWFLSLFLRLALRLGFAVVLIGPCRCGKTYLLEKTMPRNIINGAAMSRSVGFEPVLFDTVELPGVAFAIDEAQAFDATSLIKGITAMNMRKRGFAIAMQSKHELPAIIKALGARRSLVVEFSAV